MAGLFTPPTRVVCTRCRLGRRRRSPRPRSTVRGGGRAVPVRAAQIHPRLFQAKNPTAQFWVESGTKQNSSKPFGAFMWFFSISFWDLSTRFVSFCIATQPLCCVVITLERFMSPFDFFFFFHYHLKKDSSCFFCACLILGMELMHNSFTTQPVDCDSWNHPSIFCCFQSALLLPNQWHGGQRSL